MHSSKTLTNVEFMLLQIIQERGSLSGYDINQIVEERGYRAWADIGTTSIYVSLEKLAKKQWVESYIDTQKQGRGPLPKKFKLSSEGYECLVDSIREALSSTRERDKRFDLGIAACHLINTEEVIIALHKRKALLLGTKDKLEQEYKRQRVDSFSVNIQFLFRHPIHLIQCEADFMDEFIQKLREQEGMAQ